MTAPRLVQVYARRRLYDWLDAAHERPFVWVEGPAGAGKTTAVAGYLQMRKCPVLWYQIDAGDADPATFFHYLGVAVKAAARRARRPLPHLTREYRAGMETFAQRYFEELDRRLPASAVIVLDNLHAVDGENSLHSVLRAGLERLTRARRVFMISRAAPPPAYARLSASASLARLDWELLRLTEDEADGIAALRAHAPAAPVKRLYEKTQGWLAGLILLLERGDAALPGDRTLEEASPQALFDYFAAEVFVRRHPAVKEFLMLTALLPGFSAPMAERLSGNSRARTLLADFVRQHYFIEEHAEGVVNYQYHPLFREFLLQQARATWGPAELARYRHRAAAVLEHADQPEQAFALYLDAGDADAAARLLIAQARHLVATGRFEALGAAIARFAPAFVAQETWLLYWQGVYRLAVNPVEARGDFERAYRRFRAARDAEGVYLAWVGIVESFTLLWDDYRGLKPWLTELEALRGEFPSFPSRATEERVVYAAFTAGIWVAPQLTAVGKWIEPAETVARAGSDPSVRILTAASLGLYYAWTGELSKLQSVIETVHQLARPESASPLARIYALATAAIRHWMVGEAGAACRVGLEARSLAVASGVHVLDMYVLAQIVHALLNSGDLNAAEAYLEEFRRQLRPARRIDVAYWHAHAGHLAFLRGDMQRSEQHMREVLKLVQELGAAVPLLMAQVHLAEVLARTGKSDEARALIDDALPVAISIGSYRFQFNCHLTCAWIAWSADDEGECASQLRAALAIAAATDLKTYQLWDRALIAALCEVALKHEIEIGYVRNLIHTRKLSPTALSATPENWPWPIKIHTLGRFAVLLDDRPLTFAAKTQRKPLELLKALAALGGRDVGEDKIVELLWPDTEGDRGHHALEMALSRLRKLLGHPQAILAQGRNLSLNEHYIWVDVQSLAQVLDRLETALRQDASNEALISRLTAQALSLYRGPFLVEESDAPWALTLRERLRSRVLRALRAVWRGFEQAERWQQAAEGYERALEIDNLAEEFYQRLMLCYRALGRPAEALAVYRRCRQTLHAILGIAPAAETEAIAQALRQAS